MTDSNGDSLKVLVAVDFSEMSRRALAWAFDYATRAACELHIIHVVHDPFKDVLGGPSSYDLEKEMAAVAKQAETELERMVPDREEREAIGPICRHMGSGRPAPEIVRVADQIAADMIVLGSHGWSGIDRLMIGSVAEKVVRKAACPVVVVKLPRE